MLGLIPLEASAFAPSLLGPGAQRLLGRRRPSRGVAWIPSSLCVLAVEHRARPPGPAFTQRTSNNYSQFASNAFQTDNLSNSWRARFPTHPMQRILAVWFLGFVHLGVEIGTAKLKRRELREAAMKGFLFEQMFEDYPLGFCNSRKDDWIWLPTLSISIGCKVIERELSTVKLGNVRNYKC